jgi:hypothetical protein
VLVEEMKDKPKGTVLMTIHDQHFIYPIRDAKQCVGEVTCFVKGAEAQLSVGFF